MLHVYDCIVTQTVWSQVTIWIKNFIWDNIFMGTSSVLLGDYRNLLTVNLLVIIAKNQIYKYKNIKKGLHSINTTTTKRRLNSEEVLSVTRGTSMTFLGKWSPIYTVLKMQKIV